MRSVWRKRIVFGDKDVKKVMEVEVIHNSEARFFVLNAVVCIFRNSYRLNREGSGGLSQISLAMKHKIKKFGQKKLNAGTRIDAAKVGDGMDTVKRVLKEFKLTLTF